MSSEETEQFLSEEDDEFERYSDIAERVALKTIPGDDNDRLVSNVSEAGNILDKVLDDLNNWFELVDIRIFRGKVIGIPCRYRWTIKRWVGNDTDKWLIDNGWDNLAHLKADARSHKDNEMEARYHKNFGDWDVYANFYVEFTEDVFEALDGGSSKIESMASDKGENEDSYLDAIKEMRRS